jgi:hypothetical protein
LSKSGFLDSDMPRSWNKVPSPLFVTRTFIAISPPALTFPLSGVILRDVVAVGEMFGLPVDQSISRVPSADEIFSSSIFLKSSIVGSNCFDI